jgi:alkylation response protein AidB-like acyl-CoA dehydrogenase
LLLGASEELEQQYLPLVARGEAMFCFAPSEREWFGVGATITRRTAHDN